MAVMKRKWTYREVEFLKANYSSMTINRIAKVLNRGKASIHYKAKALDLVDIHRFWTNAEKTYVLDNYERGKSEQIAKHLRKSVNGVRHTAQVLGLTAKSKRWTEEDIEYLRNNYPDKTKPLAVMAEDLKTSVPALKSAAQKHGIFRKYVLSEAFCVDCGNPINKWYHTKRCITCSNKHRSGENHATWKGGISKLVDMIRRALYPVWTYPIMERDDFTCQYCGHYRNNHVHHLRPLKEIVDQVLSENPSLSIDVPSDKIKIVSMVIALHALEDGITVCKSCHISIHYTEKPGELLGSPERDNQQPSPPKLEVIVGGKVQRLTGEDSATDKPDTSARHPECATG